MSYQQVELYCLFEGIIVITIKIKKFSDIDFKESKYKGKNKDKN